MTDQDAKTKLVREIERAASDFGVPLKPGLSVFIMMRLVRDIPAILDVVKGSTAGRVS